VEVPFYDYQSIGRCFENQEVNKRSEKYAASPLSNCVSTVDGRNARGIVSQTDDIVSHLQVLVGLKLSIARRAADLRNFHFGPTRKVEGGTIGAYALHIQCPWRIEGPEGIVTGRSDLWQPVDKTKAIDWDNWDYDEYENVQDERIEAWLGGYDPETHSSINDGDSLVVEKVQADNCGGAIIVLSGGYRIVMFPAGSRGEDWRIFEPGNRERRHFVISGGRIEADE
jgi:hypothetical protein